MEAVIFVIGVIMVIVGTTIILTAWDLFWWAVGKVLGVKSGDIHDDDDGYT